jgi:hypothetical protein
MAAVVISSPSLAMTTVETQGDDAMTSQSGIQRRLYISVGMGVVAGSWGGRFGVNAQHPKITAIREAESRFIHQKSRAKRSIVGEA